MEFLRIGIAVLVIGLILSLLPSLGFGVAGTLVYIGWVLIAIGLILAVLHYVGGSARGRTRGRSL